MTELGHDADMAVDVILRDGATLRLRAPVEGDVPALVAFFAGLSVRSRFLRFHGSALAGDRFVRTLVDPDWGEKRRADRRHGRRRREARRRGRQLCPAARPAHGRGGVRCRRRLPAQGDRHPPARAARTARRGARHRGVHRRGAAGEPGHALGLREHRLRAHAHARRRRRRGPVPDRGDRGLPGARRRARPRRGDRVAAAVLRAQDGRRRRRLGAARARSAGALFRNVLAGGFTGAAYPVNRSGEPVAGVRAYTLDRGDRRSDRPLRRSASPAST